ncbi:MAG: hypothetical protein WC686_03060 [Candidatus Shapirobacteria bacterium]
MPTSTKRLNIPIAPSPNYRLWMVLVLLVDAGIGVTRTLKDNSMAYGLY